MTYKPFSIFDMVGKDLPMVWEPADTAPVMAWPVIVCAVVTDPPDAKGVYVFLAGGRFEGKWQLEPCEYRYRELEFFRLPVPTGLVKGRSH